MQIISTDIVSLLPGNQLTSAMLDFCIQSFLSHPPHEYASFIAPTILRDLRMRVDQPDQRMQETWCAVRLDYLEPSEQATSLNT